MYIREFKEVPEKLINNGKAAFGTFNGLPSKIDIKGMFAPYAGIPVPAFLSNLRIKSRLNYVFSTENFIGKASFIDFKAIGLAEFVFWNKESGKKYIYHTVMPPRRRFVPTLTTRGICASYRKARFLKISWGRKHQHHALTFKVKGDSVRPNAEGYFYSPLTDDMHCDVLNVCPSPTSSRCSATWITSMSVKGYIALNKESVEDSEGIAMMNLNRAYFKLHSKSTLTYGLGNVNGKKLAFFIKTSNMDAADSDTYNDNTLFVDGKATALPPVYITHPFGLDKNWIIQDTESMIDLTFTPLSRTSKSLNLVALRTSYDNIFGRFDGVLLTSEGEKITLKGLPGIIYRNLLRL
ncbi:MAG: DUF2804 domain-containing protein [Treponema sp.]|nr:DUF2804 domain-containing protein [Treponema sp.]